MADELIEPSLLRGKELLDDDIASLKYVKKEWKT